MTGPGRDDLLDPAERVLATALARAGTDAGGPSSQLDAAILQAARDQAAKRGHGSTSHRTRRRRTTPAWLRGGALAATLVIAVGVAWQLRPQLDGPVQDGLPAESWPTAAEQSLESRAGEVESASIVPPDARAGARDARNARNAPNVSISTPDAARARRAPRAFGTPGAPGAPGEPHAAGATVPPAPPAPLGMQAAKPSAADAASPAAADAKAAALSEREAVRSGLHAIEPTAAPLMREEAARGRARNAEAAVVSDAPTDGDGSTPPPANTRRDATQPSASHGDWFDQPLDDTPPASVDSPAVREAWLARIRELVASEDYDEARDSFAEFRRRHPAAPVPDDLRALLGGE